MKSHWPQFGDKEIDAVKEVLVSGDVNYWTGNRCRTFEKKFAEFTGSKFAIALSNGSVALDATLRSLEIGKGDEVIVTSRTFVASASAIVLAGARPVFADVCRDSQNITADTVRPLISEQTKAVICVHLAGWPCDMDPIMAVARDNGLFVIEDCAQAHGATYKGRSVGSIGDVGCWSFCQDKIMTTGGEGGMVTTNDEEIWSKIWSFKDHGKSWAAVYEQEHPPGFRWLHQTFGTNFRMMEIQAAIGLVQLGEMPTWSEKRRANAQKIWNSSQDLPGIRVPQLSCSECTLDCKAKRVGCQHAAYKCYVFADFGQENRDEIMHDVMQMGVHCFSGSCSEVYLEDAFKDAGLTPSRRLPAAKELGETSLMFLCDPTLDDTDIDRTCQIFRDVVLKING